MILVSNGHSRVAIVKAIIEGGTDGKDFFPLIDGRIKASDETIEKSLQGQWWQDQLFLLKENYEGYGSDIFLFQP